MLPIADIIRLSWQTYISKFKKYLPWTAGIFALSIVGNIIRFFIFNGATGINQYLVVGFSAAISAVVYFLTFGLIIALTILSNSLLDGKDRKIDFREDVVKVFWPALFIAILSGLVTVGGFFLFIIPGFIFTVWYAFSMYLAILEKKKGTALLAESKKLSVGRYWPVFGRLMVPAVFWGIVSYFVVSGAFNIIGLIAGEAVNVASGTNLPTTIIAIFAGDLITAFFAPIYIICNVIVYREVRK